MLCSIALLYGEIAMPDGAATIAQSPEDLRAKVNEQIAEGKPAFFRLEAQLPAQGRTDTPLAASDKMWVVLKTYAADGENGLHAHPHEDHTLSCCRARRASTGRTTRSERSAKTKACCCRTGHSAGSRRPATSRWS